MTVKSVPANGRPVGAFMGEAPGKVNQGEDEYDRSLRSCPKPKIAIIPAPWDKAA